MGVGAAPRAKAKVGNQNRGQPPFCATCKKFKKGICYDNPVNPKRANPENTACLSYNKPPQDGVFYCEYKGYRIVSYRNRIQWSKVGEPTDYNLGRIELKTFDFCQALFDSQDHVLWWGEREVWQIVYVGGDSVFQFILLGKAAHNGLLIREAFKGIDYKP